MIDRSLRAPVLRSMAFLEIAESTSAASVRSTLSISMKSDHEPAPKKMAPARRSDGAVQPDQGFMAPRALV